MIYTVVNQRVAAARPLRHANEFISHFGQYEMKKPITGGGDCPPKIDLAWRPSRRRRD
jgi:hypothetical protein